MPITFRALFADLEPQPHHCGLWSVTSSYKFRYERLRDGAREAQVRSGTGSVAGPKAGACRRLADGSVESAGRVDRAKGGLRRSTADFEPRATRRGKERRARASRERVV